MNNSGRSLGGAERRVAPAGDGSSPSGPTKRRLRQKLSRLDRLLGYWDSYGEQFCFYPGAKQRYLQLDIERRKIRERLKTFVPPKEQKK